MDKPDLTLYLGGTRSGKSARAEARVFQRADGPVLYVATAEARPDDPSMTERIRRHRARRPENWRTLECPLQLGEHIGTALAEFRNTAGTPTVLLDCITLWVSNILFSLPDPEDLSAFEGAVRLETEALLDIMLFPAKPGSAASNLPGSGGTTVTASASPTSLSPRKPVKPSSSLPGGCSSWRNKGSQ